MAIIFYLDIVIELKGVVVSNVSISLFRCYAENGLELPQSCSD